MLGWKSGQDTRSKYPLKTMSQIFDPIPTPSTPSDRLLCCYVNESRTIQIVRITDVPNWYFERVVFPTQRLVFEAMAIAHLEIHTGMMASSILSDTIPCVELAMLDAVPNPVPSYDALTLP
jgi:Domain of unknown function (DUF1830)